MAKRRQPSTTGGSSARRRVYADSNTYRFFVAPEAIQNRQIEITEPALIHQLNNVLRLSSGDAVTLLDNSGWEYAATLDQMNRDAITGTITAKKLAATEPRLKLALYVALLKGERFELVLQKGTELGVSSFVPVVCQRSVIDDIAEIGTAKLERWERIIREAAEQSRRAKLPKLRPAMLFDTACEHARRRARAFVLWEAGGTASLRTLLRDQSTASSTDRSPTHAPFSIALLSGPEGGFTDGEIATAQRYELEVASLGPRTLRAETAPIAATAAILFAHGDLD